ncbi:nuclear intron maturase 1, mitochondrial [Heracleum sosnowskyi]|uniref:Nuclear intron maturase 1, mitochondrial n=1 Tax=Heracleum sosnowskyi TaxID=360622 RepID=A0AAD8HM91_9APIA|nr:nuclear intron maturase 1, mitochondrial [Heracleum sosnowskyi]
MSLRHNIKHLARISTLRSYSHSTTHPHRLHPPQPHRPPPQQDPYTLLKEDPIQILSDLWVRSFSHHHHTQNPTPPKPFTNLTGFLSKLDIWVLAYQRTCAHVTGSFPPRNAIHFHVLSDLLSLRNAVIHSQFQWNKKIGEGVYVRSPNEKPVLRNISRRKLEAILSDPTPPFQDRVVQEALLMILEPIFEPRFSSKSHAFRPGRNAHSVIRTIRSNFSGYLWFLKGDLTQFFEDVDTNVVMRFVGNVVKDKKVLRLIKSGLRVRNGIPCGDEHKGEFDKSKKEKKKGSTRKKILNENEPKPDPYWLRIFFDFAPEEAVKVPNYGGCGILSPLLANICLNELDHLMEDKLVEFFRPSRLDSIWKDSVNDGSHNPSWPEFVPASGKEKTRKMDYIRYGGHFLIGIRGPREDAVETRKELIEFCDSNFGIRLDNSRLEIEHVTRGVEFLDHIISRRVIYPTLRYTASGGNIVNQKGVGTLLSVTASLPNCIRQFRRLKFVKGDRDPEPLPCTPMLYSGQAHTNAQMNKFLETMADWYRYADNRKKIVGFCAYVIRSSLAKLYAARYRLKSRAKVYKIASRNLSRPLVESTNNSAPEYSDLLRMGLVDAIEGVQFSHMSSIPSCDYTVFPRNWIPDHERVIHEYINLQNPKFFCELQRSIKKQGLTLPQDEISEIVWDYKTLGVRSYQSSSDKDTRNASKDVVLSTEV